MRMRKRRLLSVGLDVTPSGYRLRWGAVFGDGPSETARDCTRIEAAIGLSASSYSPSTPSAAPTEARQTPAAGEPARMVPACSSSRSGSPAAAGASPPTCVPNPRTLPWGPPWAAVSARERTIAENKAGP
jgi:hypothetical protein